MLVRTSALALAATFVIGVVAPPPPPRPPVGPGEPCRPARRAPPAPAGPAAPCSTAPCALNIIAENALDGSIPPSALLVLASGAFDSTRCASNGETLLSSVSASIGQQLVYAASTGVIDSQVWVGGTVAGPAVGPAAVCAAYSLPSKSVVAVKCSTSLPSLCTNIGKPDVTVQSGSLAITGTRSPKAFRFLGIPFAAPPTGSLRFQPATAYAGSANIKAQSFGAACIQSSVGTGLVGSEDCLTLNVFTPAIRIDKTKLKPVVLWLHGGGYTAGGSSLAVYDGENQASRSDIVVVSANYRLGALGFLATASELPGNAALTDQIAALKWIQDHIADFGGDATQVTIMGQSAGAQSVLALMSSSGAKGLFRAAIAQSPPVNVPWFSRKLYSNSITPTIAKQVGCDPSASEAALVSCLQNVDAKVFISGLAAANADIAVALAQYCGAPSAAEPLLPLVGGPVGTVNGQLVDLLAAGSLPNPVPLLVGTVHDEGQLFIEPALPPLGSDQATIDQVLPAVFGAAAGNALVSSGLITNDPSNPDGVRTAISDATRDSTWLCPGRFLLGQAIKLSGFPSIYNYRTNLGTSTFTFLGAEPGGATTPTLCTSSSPTGFDAVCHGEDVPIVFGNAAASTLTGGSARAPTARAIVDTWGAFIRTTNPLPSSAYLAARGSAYASTSSIATTWPAYSGSNVRQLGADGFSTAAFAVSAICDVFDSVKYPFQQINASLV